MLLPQGSLVLAGIAACSTVVAAKDDGSGRPRGVGPEFAKYYKDTATFACISHPGIKIPFSAVNDDYCDCPDGSDEPGTSACAYLSPLSPLTVADRPGHDGQERVSALPGFYCKNKGHRPSYVAFQRVNDGVCDYEVCCDGSDEWARVGGVKCEDRCKEIGKEWRKEEEKRQRAMSAAMKKKKAILVDAGRSQKEVEDHIGRLEVDFEAEEIKVRNLERELEEVQKSEESRAVRGRKKGRMSVLVELAKGRVEELRNALVEVRSERDETRARVKELEDILATFKVEYNPNFNDEGVKRAVRGWEDYAAREAERGGANPDRERVLDEIVEDGSDESGIDWDGWANEQDTCESDAISTLAAYLPPSVASLVEDKTSSIRGFLEKNNILPRPDEDPSSESKAVTEARDALKSAEKTRDSIRTQIKSHKNDLDTDYGTASIFRALKDVCISKDFGEYTYEHCFMDQTKQNSKKGGASVRMGRFVRIGNVSVDEVNESGEIVPVERTTLEYANGQSCWNGPSRSTTVILECGEENEILKVNEDEKCVYSMVVTSPAACAGGEAEGDAAPRRKDEL